MSENEKQGKSGQATSQKGQHGHKFDSEEARRAGHIAHEKGAQEFDHEKAQEAGREGGLEAQRRGTAHKFNHEEAQEAGSKGSHVAQDKGTAHKLTQEDAQRGGHAAHEHRK